MKKLLAAATSIVMSASFITSAFASSITVSAAGGVSAVQPNVSMGGVLDEAVNKNATASDFIVTAPDITVKPGDTVKVEFKVESNGHKGILLNTKVGELPQGITYTVADADGVPSYDQIGEEYHAKVLGDDGTAAKFDDSKPILILKLKVPDTAKAGSYSYGLDLFHVVETAFKPVSEFDATLKKGTITIEGGGSSTTDPGKPPVSGDQEDFVLTGSTVNVKPGDSANIDFTVQSGGHSAVLVQAELDVSKAGTSNGLSYAVNTSSKIKALDCDCEHTYDILDDDGYVISANLINEDTKKASTLVDGNSICRVKVTASSSAKAGTYYLGFKTYHVVEQSLKPVKEFDAKVNYATIVVGDGGDTPAPATTTKAPDVTPTVTTTAAGGQGTTGDFPANPSQSGKQDDFVLTGSEITLAPGESGNIDFIVQSGGHKAVIAQAELDLANAGTKNGLSYAVNTSSKIKALECECEHTYDILDDDGYVISANLINEETKKASELKDGASICRIKVTASDDADEGKYIVGFKTYHVVEQSLKPVKEFDATVNYAKVEVKKAGGNDTPATTTKANDPVVTTTKAVEPAATTTKANDPITPTTTEAAPTPVSGTAVWVIDTVEAKAGSEVKVNIFVNGASDLKVAGASFGVTANTVQLQGASGTNDAYKSEIFCNPTSAEIAFGHGVKGEGYAAADKAVIATLTYKVPADAEGTYDLTWKDAVICDTNGNIITDKVTLTPGAIKVTKGDAPVSGNIEWAIDKVTAKAGTTVEVPVIVKGDAAVKVAGAQFGISAETVKIASVVDGKAYGSEMFYNLKDGEFAFGHGNKGTGVAAANGAKIVVLMVEVPAGTKTGTYPIKWNGSTFISDENGNNIAENITLTPGSVTVTDNGASPADPETGDVTWTIPEKHAKPGDTVEMDVIATIGEKNPAIAGAQFKIAASDANAIAFAGVTGSDAYGSKAENNATTNEFAFAQAIGKGVKADNNSVVLHLTYKVSEKAEPGTYPVTWADAVICDENGNVITGTVKLVDGAIIVDPETPAETTTKAEDPAVTTTAESNPVETTATAAATTTEGTPAVTTTQGGDTPAATTTAPVTAPVGGVIWQIDTKVVEPGSDVTLNVVISDPDGSKLPVAGAQYLIKCAADNISFTDASKKSDAYGADIIANMTSCEFAFADAKGEGKASADGAIVMTLTYKVAADCEDGVYNVEFVKDFTSISSADGVSLNDKVSLINGAIIVKKTTPAATTTAGTPAATTTEGTPATTTEGTPATTTEGTPAATTTAGTPATTTAAPATTAGTPAVTTAVAPHEGAIVWQIPTKAVKAGDEVELDVFVSDPNAVKLPVGGAQFTIKYENAENKIALAAGEGSAAYETDFSGINVTTGEFAFAHPNGQSIAAANGGIVMKLKFTVSAEAKPGTYAVAFDKLEVMDGDGVDITKNVVPGNGAIIVLEPDTPAVTTAAGTTTAGTPATTEAAPASTTAGTPATTEAAPASTTAGTPATTEGTPATTTAAAPTTTEPAVTETPVPAGKIGWVLDSAKGKPGETVTLTMVVSNTPGVDLQISGGQYVLGVTASDGKDTPAVASAMGKPYGADLIYNAATKEFAFADAKGAGSASIDRANIMTVNFVIPKDAAAGTVYMVTVDGIVAIDGTGKDVSGNVVGGTGFITVIAPDTTTAGTPATTTAGTPATTTAGTPATTTAGTPATTTAGTPATTTAGTPVTTTAGTPATTTEGAPATTTGGDPVATTTAPATTQAPDTATGVTTTRPTIVGPVDVDATVKVVDGFYFSHDPRPFKTDHVKADQVSVTESDGNKTLVDFDPSYLTFEEAVSKASNPEDAYKEGTFAYTVNVFYGGQPLMRDGKQITFTAYVGVKGDTNFDGAVDADDASTTLKYYALKQTKGSGADVRLAPENCEVVNANPALDELAAFLADVDLDVYSKDNWSTPKIKRVIDADDASSILKFYAIKQTNADLKDHEVWNRIFAGTNGADSREDLFNDYVK